MDAWSATIRDHTSDNAHLQTAWSASTWPRAAEIIKHVHGNWPNAGRFATILHNVYYAEIQGSDPRTGNWELSIAEAIVGIGVFLDGKAVLLHSDGALPKTVPSNNLNTREKIIGFWHNRSTFVSGLTQETCRDFVHTGYGLSAISHVAETSRIQGVDLCPEVGTRLREALGLQTTYELTGADHRGRLQPHAQHRDVDDPAPSARHQQPVRVVGDPDPRRQPGLSNERGPSAMC